MDGACLLWITNWDIWVEWNYQCYSNVRAEHCETCERCGLPDCE